MGVTDDLDLCPLVPGKAAWHGCPVPDSDHDGIDDEHDSCKNVPGVARYNGCPIPDSDHDGINDEEDKCPYQAGVGRYNGCPIPDRDGDGINDEEDKCPDSAGTAENHGCPVVKEIKKEATEQINYIAHNILFNSASDQLTDSSYSALSQAGRSPAGPSGMAPGDRRVYGQLRRPGEKPCVITKTCGCCQEFPGVQRYPCNEIVGNRLRPARSHRG